MTVSLTRTVSFRASHRLYRPEWSAEQNRERFGWTSDPPGHHHDYRCTVTVSGPVDRETTTVIDLAILDRILQDRVVGPLDGTHLNDAVPSFHTGELLPTCEGLACWIAGEVEAGLPTKVTLERVLVAEDETLHAEWQRAW